MHDSIRSRPLLGKLLVFSRGSPKPIVFTLAKNVEFIEAEHSSFDLVR
jgi:hypothetical protein